MEELRLKKYDNIKTCFKILISLWVFIFIVVIIYSNYQMYSYVENEIGNNAITLGTYIANTVKLSNEEYLYLKSITFRELLDSEINKEFEKTLKNVMDISDYKYVYLISRLEENEKKYGKEVIYLLDAVCNMETRIKEAKDRNYYDDIIRYDMSDGLFKEVEKTKIPSYKIAKNKWGEYIYAYIPFYTVEGNYIGLIGIDMDIKELKKTRDKYKEVIRINIIVNFMVGLLSFSLYCYMKKVHNDLKKEAHLSGIDDLTHVFNRRKFNQIFIELWERAKMYGQNMSLMLIDLDYFKEFNDNYGHFAGDNMLKSIGEILEKESSKHGGYVCRYGGDEFVILFPNLDITKAEEAGNNILVAINNARIEHQYSPIGEFQTASIGVTSMIPKDGININEFFNYADAALYLSKRYGRNKVSVWR
ncbi:diguanylate cyclase (GGDEF) domain-containing protein [Tissierella praeacuta DSM 18095]|uniref:Diguanylate cyclase (GGDEF) domain-containing protein n=2 Tax=Tissierella praeacuta TaxID=43131 RepID=A0A1M4VHI4_9FIRM|nr:GGDEF domain-containing protein [Tissierella praeacuta]SHE68481.1 diguanylate cyclase (GGDEF) domain-containing protein [Tissierella praeacuta DSM 18095]SUO99135.1 Bacteriophytochrome cph2 [Tissierella praeacuta]